MTAGNRKPVTEEVIREYPPLGKYRVRLLGRPDRAPVLDIREYVASDSFEGFTRRGIRLADLPHMDLLRDILKEVIERDHKAKVS